MQPPLLPNVHFDSSNTASKTQGIAETAAQSDSVTGVLVVDSTSVDRLVWIGPAISRHIASPPASAGANKSRSILMKTSPLHS